jgi:hypothetical protein
MQSKAQIAPRAIRYRAAGLCGCGRPPKPGCKSCKTCTDKIHLATKVRKQTPGHCKGCGKGDQPQGRYCEVCTRNRAEARRRTKQRRAELGQCGRCQEPAAEGAALCQVHLEKVRATSLAYHRAKAAQVRALQK